MLLPGASLNCKFHLLAAQIKCITPKGWVNKTLAISKTFWFLTVCGAITNFWHAGILTTSPECQSARMSKITNNNLTGSGTGCFIAVSICNSGRQRVKVPSQYADEGLIRNKQILNELRAHTSSILSVNGAVLGFNQQDISSSATDSWCHGLYSKGKEKERWDQLDNKLIVTDVMADTVPVYVWVLFPCHPLLQYGCSYKASRARSG